MKNDARSARRGRALGVFVAAVVLLVARPTAAETFGDLIDVEVVRVYDGDTFFADIDSLHPLLGEEIGIRVRGVDTPEIRGRCERERILARMARDAAAALLTEAERVDLIEVERGKYFRIVATVLVDGVDLAHALISQGLAVEYVEGARIDWCE